MAALVAIDGGSLTVLFLTWCNVKLPQAIGTSAAVGLPIALAGTLGYAINGWGIAGLPSAALGSVYCPLWHLWHLSASCWLRWGQAGAPSAGSAAETMRRLAR